MNNSFTCQHCGASITDDMVKCEYCGCQINFPKPQKAQNIVINNYYNAANYATKNITTRSTTLRPTKAVNKWVSFWLCLFLGYLGAHKYYEGQIGIGILYFCTCGLFGIGWIIDIFDILSKPNPYYV